MSDFASAAMIRVLMQGMRELGLKSAVHLPPKFTGNAKVELDVKRTLLESAMRQGGMGCLPLLGRGLKYSSHDPTYRALVSASTPFEFFARWNKLERYIHSRHRVRVRHVRPDGAELCHVTICGNKAPLPAENLVVLGVMAALLESISARTVMVRIGKIPAYPSPDGTALERAARSGLMAHWQFTWNGVQAPSRLPEYLSAHTPGVEANPLWPYIAKEACRVLATDLMTPPRVSGVASALNMSSRTLQRSLTRAGLSYSTLLAETRCRATSWWLLNSNITLAQIGFLCGYADQPHFTREFRFRVGVTPAKYREEFTALRLPIKFPRAPGGCTGMRNADEWQAADRRT